MKTYNLTTWAAHGLVAYEPIVAPSTEEAAAYASGMLKERTKDDLETLGRLGVSYQLGEGDVALTELEVLDKSALTAIRSWAINPTASGMELASLS